MSPAIFYQPAAYSTGGPALMGRQVAGEGFLRGYVAHATCDRFVVQGRDADHVRPFAELVAASGRREPVALVADAALGALAGCGTIFYPGPNLADRARERGLFGDAAWSICGVTHTTASDTAMDAIADLLVGPIQPWDALICTSRAVRANVETVLAAQAEYLARRFGGTASIRPQLPLIPLGIHADDFVFADGERAAARRSWGIGDDTLVVLFAGRLSFHGKAHPAAMYQALEAAAARTGRSVLLVEAGWFAGDAVAEAYRAAGDLLCPSIAVVRLDGRDPALRRAAWAGADVFCSLADNIQESFGLTPLEAMAAGLPVVVSDWDGYRDTVRDGVDGFRVRTVAPPAGLGTDLAQRFATRVDSYDRYCGYASSLVAVDLAAATDAFATLLDSPDRRRAMGEAGRRRVRAEFDWRAIIPAYEALWAELGERRARTATPPPAAHPWPARMDPFAAFARYPTEAVGAATIVALADGDAAAASRRFHRLATLEMIRFAAPVLSASAELDALIERCAAGPVAAGTLVEVLPPDRRGLALRSLVWLAKIGVLRLS